MGDDDIILGEKESEGYMYDMRQSDEIDAMGKVFQEGFEIISAEHIYKESDSYFYAYDIGHKCFRLKYYNILQPRKLAWSKKRKFAVNSGIHSAFQSSLVAKGWTVEQPMHKKYDKLGFEISVKFDAILGSIGNIENLVEIKVPWFFTRLDKPYVPNVHQVQQYIEMLDIDEGTLVYIDAMTGKNKSFRIVRDDDIIRRNLEKLEDIRYALLHGVLPEKTRSYTCSDCLYKLECKGNINIGVK